MKHEEFLLYSRLVRGSKEDLALKIAALNGVVSAQEYERLKEAGVIKAFKTMFSPAVAAKAEQTGAKVVEDATKVVANNATKAAPKAAPEAESMADFARRKIKENPLATIGGIGAVGVGTGMLAFGGSKHSSYVPQYGNYYYDYANGAWMYKEAGVVDAVTAPAKYIGRMFSRSGAAIPSVTKAAPAAASVTKAAPAVAKGVRAPSIADVEAAQGQLNSLITRGPATKQLFAASDHQREIARRTAEINKMKQAIDPYSMISVAPKSSTTVPLPRIGNAPRYVLPTPEAEIAVERAAASRAVNARAAVLNPTGETLPSVAEMARRRALETARSAPSASGEIAAARRAAMLNPADAPTQTLADMRRLRAEAAARPASGPSPFEASRPASAPSPSTAATGGAAPGRARGPSPFEERFLAARDRFFGNVRQDTAAELAARPGPSPFSPTARPTTTARPAPTTTAAPTPSAASTGAASTPDARIEEALARFEGLSARAEAPVAGARPARGPDNQEFLAARDRFFGNVRKDVEGQLATRGGAAPAATGGTTPAAAGGTTPAAAGGVSPAGPTTTAATTTGATTAASGRSPELQAAIAEGERLLGKPLTQSQIAALEKRMSRAATGGTAPATAGGVSPAGPATAAAGGTAPAATGEAAAAATGAAAGKAPTPEQVAALEQAISKKLSEEEIKALSNPVAARAGTRSGRSIGNSSGGTSPVVDARGNIVQQRATGAVPQGPVSPQATGPALQYDKARVAEMEKRGPKVGDSASFADTLRRQIKENPLLTAGIVGGGGLAAGALMSGGDDRRVVVKAASASTVGGAARDFGKVLYQEYPGIEKGHAYLQNILRNKKINSEDAFGLGVNALKTVGFTAGIGAGVKKLVKKEERPATLRIDPRDLAVLRAQEAKTAGVFMAPSQLNNSSPQALIDDLEARMTHSGGNYRKTAQAKKAGHTKVAFTLDPNQRNALIGALGSAATLQATLRLKEPSRAPLPYDPSADNSAMHDFRRMFAEQTYDFERFSRAHPGASTLLAALAGAGVGYTAGSKMFQKYKDTKGP